MASITKRKSKYSVVYDYYDEEGVRHQKWETWGTYAEAKRRKAEIEHKQTNNTFVKPSIKTVSELLYDFMNLYGVNAWALSTYDSKKGLIDNYINPIIGKAKIKDIKRDKNHCLCQPKRRRGKNHIGNCTCTDPIYGR